jgi:hypothetical protein
VSGFDFDALRDPDAPRPGASQRGGVDARARQLRARSVRNRVAISTSVIVAVVAIIAGIAAGQRSNGPEISVPGSTTIAAPTPTTSTSAPNSVDERFVPPTTIENGKVVLPVTLPDGETFTVRYPPSMKIAQLGFTSGINLNWPESTSPVCCGEVAEISYATIADVYGNAKPLAVYRGPNGESVPLFNVPRPPGLAPAGPTGPNRELAFQFGPWLVRVGDGVEQPHSFSVVPFTGEQLVTWAQSLTGTVDTNGYLVLHARAPISIGNRFFGGFGSPTEFDDNYSRDNVLSFDAHIQCGHPLSPIPTPYLFGTLGNGNVQWCVNKVLHVQATGRSSFLTLALHNLQLSPLIPPAGSTPTSATVPTTTIAAPRTTSPAVSASFVSPDQGWVLEQNGNVGATTDGGASWQVVGSIGHTAPSWKLRFANTYRGFAFPGDESDPSPLLTTDDGGATWSALPTPFISRVYDLAIARGIVYAVGFGPGGFHIWSAPAGTLSWTEDPLSIPAGAGPVPQIQLVFSGAHGWLIENDRVVSAGARLTTNGHWATWKPPCVGVGGPALLTASTATDLVALCDKGTWTGGPITIGVYFSHDGGATFARHDAPLDGGVASPSAHIAVISTANSLQRTTDDGATWQSVFAESDQAGGGRELGFTNLTQGYAILQNGQMIMTYDAGATWKRVALP